MEASIAAPAGNGEADGSGDPGPRRLLFRFGLGLIALGGERFGSILASSSATEAPPTDLPFVAPAPRHAALGLLIEGVAIGRRGRALLGTGLARGASAARRLLSPLARAGRLLGRAPGATRLAQRVRALRADGNARLARWAAAGVREESAGRALARTALTALREQTIARAAESPDLKQVIRDQSEGIAVTAVAELRARSARADGRAEGVVRRLLGRRPREGSP